MRCLYTLLIFVLIMACSPSPDKIYSPDSILPRPANILLDTDGAVWTPDLDATIILYPGPNVSEQALKDLLAPLQTRLETATSEDWPISQQKENKGISFVEDQTLTGIDTHRIEVSADRIEVRYLFEGGLAAAVQSLLQMIPSESFDDWGIRTGTITDYARFSWRGYMLDVARHFFSYEEVATLIPILARYKINRLHLHLTDDQGWRLQIPELPALAAVGATSQTGGGPGGFYTLENYIALQQLAEKYGITVVPEIDIPGHIQSALVSYPDLSCEEEHPIYYSGTDVGFSKLCKDSALTLSFLETVFSTVAEHTKGPWIHFGGDEVFGMDEDEYAWFVTTTRALIYKSGKTPLSWGDAWHVAPSTQTTLQHWKTKEVAAAVEQGAQLIMSPATKTYLDLKYNQDTMIGTVWAGTLGVQEAYEWDPATLLPGVGSASVLGVEAPLWTETVATLGQVHYMSFPRLLALAEVAWTEQTKKDWQDFRRRVALQGPYLRQKGIRYYQSLATDWR